MNVSDIINENNMLAEKLKDSQVFDVAILSNIILNPLKDILEYTIRCENINVHCWIGNYDNIIQDAQLYRDKKLIIIFWEAANLVDGLQYKANLWNKETLNGFIDKTKAEIDLALDNLAKTKYIIFNKFSSIVFNHKKLENDNFDIICKSLNEHLEKKNNHNLFLVDINKILADLSINSSVDFRYFYSAKSLYTNNYFKSYAEFIKPIIISLNGLSKKALILDCDNTLWKGILGEDGIKNIAVSSKHAGGTPYEEVQAIILNLSQKGIIIGLNSKNNPEDVEEVFKMHMNEYLIADTFVIKKINWKNKVENLLEIAKDLNIGIDSIVFVDDTDFEIELVKKNLPQVMTLKVPGKSSLYPQYIKENLDLFFSTTKSVEDLQRTQMYLSQKKRDNEKGKFNDFEGYLKSLQLNIRFYKNPRHMIPRIAQLTQKTNQFNLTTKRYTEAEIEEHINNKSTLVAALEVMDKFGNYGVTALSICRIVNGIADVDTFLMSCRIIGRNIEFAFFDRIVKSLNKVGVKKIKADYKKSSKNSQVSDFYEKIGFRLISSQAESKNYEILIDNYNFFNLEYIRVENGN